MNDPIISVSGLRGIVGDSLNPQLAIAYATAFVSTLRESGPIVVSRDGRGSGSLLAGAICAGVAGCGRDILFANVAATPTTGVLVRHQKAAGGIQVSASHNPAPYNGIKLFSSEGRVVSAELGQAVLEAYHSEQRPWASHDALGDVKTLKDTTSKHLELVLATVDRVAIANRKFKVVLDSNRGAGAILGRRLLEELGCEIRILGEQPDGNFEHQPEPTEHNLQSTVQNALGFQADAVFCQDPDADRLAIIDEQGNYIGEEYTLAITANHALEKHKGPLVTNCSSSRMSADIAANHGCSYHVSAVGEANVTEMMIAENAVFGGEGNGGPIDPRVGYVRDSFVAMAQVLDAMADSDQTVSQLAAQIPKYEICKTVISLDRKKTQALFDALEKRFNDATTSRLDGIRLDWPNRWLLVRPSNTEPIVRAIAEAASKDAAQELCQEAKKIADSL